MRVALRLAAGVALFGTAIGAVAGEFDGSKPVLCAAVEAVECQARQECVQGPADIVNLPVFFRIDFQEKTVTTTKESGEKRTSRILNTTTDAGTLVLQGAEQDTGWSIAINEVNGKMTLGTAAEGVAYIVFGACTPL